MQLQMRNMVAEELTVEEQLTVDLVANEKINFCDCLQSLKITNEELLRAY
jgi:hypothetical protein